MSKKVVEEPQKAKEEEREIIGGAGATVVERKADNEEKGKPIGIN